MNPKKYKQKRVAPRSVKVKKQETIPASEVSDIFMQGMYDRMAFSYFKYGPVAKGFPDKVDAIASLKDRLENYEKDGNAEWLMDIANFAMIEYMRPRHPKAHFHPTDEDTTGRRTVEGTQTTKGNLDLNIIERKP